MKIKLLYLIPVLLGAAVIFSSTSSGRAAGANQGNTGAPGDNSRTCVSCHNTGNIEVDLNISLLNASGQEVTSYVPGQTYTVRVQIDSIGGPAALAWGFQMVCLEAPLDVNGEDLENWVDMGPNNYKIANARGRQYAEQSGPSSSNIFDVTWVAPERNTGPVSFYAAGNGVNFNGGTSGDGADTDKIEIAEDVASSISDLWQDEVKLSPNPSQAFAILSTPDDFIGQAQIYSLTGNILDQVQLGEGDRWEINTGILKSGIYLIKLTHQNGSTSTIRLMRK